MKYQCVRMLFASRTTLDCVLFFLCFSFSSTSQAIASLESQKSYTNVTKINNILYITTFYDCVSLQDIHFLLLMLLFLQASIAHYFSKLKAIKPMNKGNKVSPKKTVSVAASAPLLPRGEQYTPCEAKHNSISSKCSFFHSCRIGFRRCTC
jgi:hypothetical protein